MQVSGMSQRTAWGSDAILLAFPALRSTSISLMSLITLTYTAPIITDSSIRAI